MSTIVNSITNKTAGTINKIKTNNQMLNYTFLVFSVFYYIIIHLYFNKLFVTNESQREKYDKDTKEKNYSFTRVYQVILKNFKSYGIGSVIFTYFLCFIIFIYLKLKQTQRKDSGRRIFHDIIKNVTKSLSLGSDDNDYLNTQQGSFRAFIALFLLLFLIVYILSNLILYIFTFLFTIKSFVSILLFSLNILFLAIAVGSIYTYSKNNNSINKTIKGTKLLIFFKLLETTFLLIPCLINDAIANLSKTKSNTPQHIFVILLIEIALVVTSIILPILNKWVTKNFANVILDKPIYLNNTQNIGDYKYYDNGIILYSADDLRTYTKNERYNLFDETYAASGNSNIKGNFDNNYSISFWFYINPQPMGTNTNVRKNTRLIDFAKRPLIEYNAEENKIYIKVINGNPDINMETIVELQNIKLQKWNNIVINHASGFLDVFLDGKLVDSRDKVIPSMIEGPILSGDNEGINGRIANVAYYNEPLNKVTIDLLYNANRNRTPVGGSIIVNSRFIVHRVSQTDLFGSILDKIAHVLAKYLPSFNTIQNFDSTILNLPNNIINYFWYLIDVYIFDFEKTEKKNDQINNNNRGENSAFEKDLLDRKY